MSRETEICPHINYISEHLIACIKATGDHFASGVVGTGKKPKIKNISMNFTPKNDKN
jgi:hypothetical protein